MMENRPTLFNIATFALVALTFVGVGYLVYQAYKQKKDEPTAPSFREDEGRYATDLVGKAVTLPQGQLWGFNWDQQITVSQASKKVLDDNTVLLVVDVKAIAKLTPPVNPHTPPIPNKEKEGDKEKPPQAQPRAATLAGYMKLLYERVNEQWYLSTVDGLALKVTVE